MTREVVVETNRSTEELAEDLFNIAFEIAGEINQVDYELSALIRDLKVTVEVKIEEAGEDE